MRTASHISDPGTERLELGTERDPAFFARHLPDPAVIPLEPVRLALEALAALRGRQRAERDHLAELKARRPAARRTDVQAVSDSVRTGDAFPASTLEQLESEIREVEAIVTALRTAELKAIDELVEAVGANRDALVAELSEPVEAIQARARSAIDELSSSLDELVGAHHLRAWGSLFPEGGEMRPVAELRMPLPANRADDSIALGDVFRRLRELAS